MLQRHLHNTLLLQANHVASRGGVRAMCRYYVRRATVNAKVIRPSISPSISAEYLLYFAEVLQVFVTFCATFFILVYFTFAVVNLDV